MSGLYAKDEVQNEIKHEVSRIASIEEGIRAEFERKRIEGNNNRGNLTNLILNANNSPELDSSTLFDPNASSGEENFDSIFAEISKPEYGYSPQELLTLGSKTSGELIQLITNKRNQFATELDAKESDRVRQLGLESDFAQQFPELLTSNQDTFINDIITELTNRGITGEDFRDQVTTESDRISQSVPTAFGTDVQSFFNPDTLIEDIFTEQVGNLQRDNIQVLVDEFGNLNQYGSTVFNNNYDDEIINNILSAERKPTLEFLDRALARGQLSPEGYNSAIGELDRLGSEAFTTAQNIGNDVLTSARGDLSGLLGTIQENAGNSNFLDQYDPNQSITQVNDLISSLTGTIPGQLESSISGAINFNPQELLNFGGRSQGAIGSINNNINSQFLPSLLGSRLSKNQVSQDKKPAIRGF